MTLSERVLLRRKAGDVALEKFRHKEAAHAFRDAIELCGPEGEASLLASCHYNLGIAAVGAGDTEAAVEALKEAARLEPTW